MIQGRDYEYEILSDPFSDQLGFKRSDVFRYYDKHDMFGNYREVTKWIYDYKLVIEYTYKNIKYQKEIIMENSSLYLDVNKKIQIYFRRKNPNNVFLKPILELF